MLVMNVVNHFQYYFFIGKIAYEVMNQLCIVIDKP